MTTITTELSFVNNIKVTVPSSPTFMTTFVLMEQGDWFEDEIKFIRNFLQPGMKVIDIGSNYGLYALTMANAVGEGGRVWSFEPTSDTAGCQSKSITANGFKNIELVQCGLSNRVDNVKLYTASNSEWNSLTYNPLLGNEYEMISLLTLDSCFQKYQWTDIDFIKLDAEGEEAKIIDGGEMALSRLTPLIMFELKHGNTVNKPLISKFKNIGYSCYRLLPALNILIPFDHEEPHDPFILNLFCCKDDRADQLETRGVLVREWDVNATTPSGLAFEYINSLPYGRILIDSLQKKPAPDSDPYIQVLNSFVASLSGTAPASRVGLLMSALQGMSDLMNNGENRVERLASFARIAFDAGERVLGVEILINLFNTYDAYVDGSEISSLFFPPLGRYDRITPDRDLKEWLLSSICEALIDKHEFSIYFSKDKMKPVFERLNAIGYVDDNMRKRYQLWKTVYPS